MDEVKRCRKCQAELKPDEPFCPSCGNKVVLTAEDYKQKAESIGMKHIKQTHQAKIRSGRTAILIVAILTLLFGVVIYFVGKNEVAKVAAMAAEEDLRKAENLLLLFLIVNLFLAAVYVGLWFWAKTRPFPASMIALLIYLAMWGLSIIIDPRNLVAGLLVRIIIVAVLLNAVTSAYKYRKMVDAHV